MAGTELAVVKMNKPVAWVEPKAMNKEAAKRYLSRVAGPKTPFVGKQVRANGQEGFLQVGYGDNAEQFDDITAVINVPQTLAVWQYWPDGEAPTYPYVAPLFGGDMLPSRDKCGPEETKWNKLKKADEDVWKEGLVLILRDPKTNELSHLQAFGNVNMRAGEFLMGISDAAELEAGKLPLVKISFEKVKLKSGEKFYAIKFDVVDWVKAVKADMPNGMSAAVEAAQDEDEEQDEAPRSKRATASASKPAASTRRPRDEEEEEAEEEAPRARRATAPKHDPRNGNGYSDDPRNNPRQPEDDEDEDEDDKPRAISRSSVKSSATQAVAKPNSKRRDEEEEEEQPVRRLRAALR